MSTHSNPFCFLPDRIERRPIGIVVDFALLVLRFDACMVTFLFHYLKKKKLRPLAKCVEYKSLVVAISTEFGQNIFTPINTNVENFEL